MVKTERFSVSVDNRGTFPGNLTLTLHSRGGKSGPELRVEVRTVRHNGVERHELRRLDTLPLCDRERVPYPTT